MNNFPAPLATEAPARLPTPELGPWLHMLLALLLQLAGLLSRYGSPGDRDALLAIDELRDILARSARGEPLPLPHAAAAHRRRTPEMRPRMPRSRMPRARIPRSQRRFLLVPGIFAALFFTPRAAIAARARFAARLRTPPARITPFSKMSRSRA